MLLDGVGFDYEVAIAGAGPAGCATAAALVKADPSLRGRILVVERARFPRAKPCGGGLTGHCEEALAAVGLALTVPSFASPRGIVRLGSVVRAVDLPRPVRVVRREEFDASLAAQVRDLGVELREGAPMKGFSVEDRGVTIALGGSVSVRARVLVGADGAGSLVRKHLVGHRAPAAEHVRQDAALPTTGADLVRQDRARAATPIRLFRAELPASAVAGAASDAMLYDFTQLGEGLRGYVWIFPVPGDRVNVGLMHFPSREPGCQRTGKELAALLGRALAARGVTLDEGALRGWPAWGYHPRTPVSAPHLLTVGDAAGIDALTGEGIAVALEQGAVAASQILSALNGKGLDFIGYREALRRATVGRELAVDRWLAWLLYGGGMGGWRRWMSLVLDDERLLEAYAARVSGTMILSDNKRILVGALWRHLWRARRRRKALAAALSFRT